MKKRRDGDGDRGESDNDADPITADAARDLR